MTCDISVYTNLVLIIDYDDERKTPEMTKYIKNRMHQFIFKVSEKVSKSAQSSKWNVNFESFFSKVHLHEGASNLYTIIFVFRVEVCQNCC